MSSLSWRDSIGKMRLGQRINLAGNNLMKNIMFQKVIVALKEVDEVIEVHGGWSIQ